MAIGLQNTNAAMYMYNHICKMYGYDADHHKESVVYSILEPLEFLKKSLFTIYVQLINTPHLVASQNDDVSHNIW